MNSTILNTRVVPCRILSFAGWIEAAIRIAPRVAFIDHLNRPDQPYRLVDVKNPVVAYTFIQPNFRVEGAEALGTNQLEGAEVGRKCLRGSVMAVDCLAQPGNLHRLRTLERNLALPWAIRDKRSPQHLVGICQRILPWSHKPADAEVVEGVRHHRPYETNDRQIRQPRPQFDSN